MENTLKAAVVGVGHLGKEHARIYSEMRGVDLVAVVDADPGRAREVADRLGTRWLTDCRELPEALDLASVVVPTAWHFEVACSLLDRGVAVLVEKPLARTVDEAERLVRLAEARATPLQVGHIERFNPAIQAIRDMEIHPRYIESHRLSPYTFRSRDVGVVLDLLIHDLDLVLELTGSDVDEIHAVGGAIFSPTEDMVNARLVLTNGCVANVTANRVSLKRMRRFRIFSDDSFITLDFEKHYGFLCKKGPRFDAERDKLGEIDVARIEDPEQYVFNGLLIVKEIEIDRYEPLAREIESFVDAVRRGVEPEVPGRVGLRAMRTAERILAALRIHRWGERPRTDGPKDT